MFALFHSVSQLQFLGDPMQLIFNFRGTQIPSWQAEVLNYFPPANRVEYTLALDKCTKPRAG